MPVLFSILVAWGRSRGRRKPWRGASMGGEGTSQGERGKGGQVCGGRKGAAKKAKRGKGHH
jgi:hypothetical protein